MNSEITPTPEKAKRAPLPDNYHPTVCFALIFAAFAVMLLYRADDVFGAVGLRAFYTIGGIASVFVAALTIVGLFVLWRALSAGVGLSLAVAIVAVAAAFNYQLFGLILVGWITYLPSMLIPPVLLAAGAIFVLGLWLYQRRQGYAGIQPRLLKFITVCILILTPLYLLGIGAEPRHAEFSFVSSEQSADHHYYLALNYGWLGDPDRLALYECNAFALACESVYKSPPDYYSYPLEHRDSIKLVPDETTGSITIYVDDKILYTVRFQAKQ